MLLGWLCIYPIINLTSCVLSPFTEGWPTLLKSFLQTVILVPVMVTVLGFLQKRFSKWLNK